MRGKASLVFLLLLAMVFTAVMPAMAQQTDLNFDDLLTGPSSPHLSSDFIGIGNKYTYGPGGLTRTQADFPWIDGFPLDRVMVKTVSGAFLAEDFVFDVDVTSPTGVQDLIYVGFGEGLANPNYFNEPTNSFEFRIHNLPGFTGVHAAVDVGLIGMGFTFIDTLGFWNPSTTTTFRITRSGNAVTLSVPSLGPGASRTVPLSLVGSLNSGNAYLFFGNSTAVGTTFSNFHVHPPAVQDTTPPVISSLTASPPTLWPPNHKMVPVTLNAVASDNVGVTLLKIVMVTSNEPDNGLGDGDTPFDIQVTGDLRLNLRAERSGTGNGRTYAITVEARDAAGNSTLRTTNVTVPKSQSGK